MTKSNFAQSREIGNPILFARALTLRAVRGSALLVSLWILTVFTLFGSSLGFRGGLEAKILKHHRELVEMQAIALGGARYTGFLIETNPEPGVAWPKASWYGKLALPAELPFKDRLSIEVRDEESKININKAPPEVLEALISVLKDAGVPLETDPRDLVSGIILWRGGSWHRGKTALDLDEKKRPFETLDEMLLIPFIARSDYERLKDYVTVYGNARDPFLKVNVNTASPLTLKALVKSLSGDEFAKAELLDKLITFREFLREKGTSLGRRPYFIQQDLSPQNLVSLLDLSSTVPIISLVHQFVRYLAVDSNFYEVKQEVKIDPKRPALYVRAVLGSHLLARAEPATGMAGFFGAGGVTGPLATGLDLEIIYWNEETYW